MDVTEILSRLTKVRQIGGDKWIACCPAHRDRTPSMTIRALDDGRILLHDFGGCDIGAICDAIGVSISDLFADRPMFHRAKPVSHPFTAQDALRALCHEVGVVTLASAEIAEGVQLSQEDRVRLALAADRIQEAATYVGTI